MSVSRPRNLRNDFKRDTLLIAGFYLLEEELAARSGKNSRLRVSLDWMTERLSQLANVPDLTVREVAYRQQYWFRTGWAIDEFQERSDCRTLQ